MTGKLRVVRALGDGDLAATGYDGTDNELGLRPSSSEMTMRRRLRSRRRSCPGLSSTNERRDGAPLDARETLRPLSSRRSSGDRHKRWKLWLDLYFNRNEVVFFEA